MRIINRFICLYRKYYMNNDSIVIGNFVEKNPNCGHCSEQLKYKYWHELNLAVKINDTIYCTTCIESNIKSVDELKQQNKALEERMNDLEKLVNELSDIIYYAPNGPGYEVAKTHFNSLKN